MLKRFPLYGRVNLQRSIVLVFIFAVLTIALFVRLISVNSADTKSTDSLVNLTYTISKYADNIKAEVTESEAATRAYLITADSRWLETVRNNRTHAAKLLTEVSGLAKDPIQKKRIHELKSLVEEKLNFELALAEDSLSSSLAARLRYDGEEQRMSRSLHATLGLFMDRQNMLLEQRTQASNLAKNRALATTIIGTAILFIFISGTMIKLNKDINRRKQAEEEIAVSEKKYRRLIEDAGVTMFTASLQGEFTYVSGRCQALTGYGADELLGKSFASLLSPEWIEQVVNAYQDQVLNGKDTSTIEFPIRTKSGQQKWVEQSAVLLHDDAGNASGFQCIVQDITDKKEQEEKIRESEYRFRTTLEKLGDNVWEHDFRSDKTYFSKTGYELLGYAAGDFDSNVNLWWESVVPEDRHILEENDRKYKAGATEQHSLEYRMVTKLGNIRWVLDRGVVIDKTPDGKPVKILGTHSDITELKQAGEKLRESDHKIRAMLESSKEGFYMIGADHSVVMLNEAGSRILEMMNFKKCYPGDDFLDFILPERKNIFLRLFNQVLAGSTEENEVNLKTAEGDKWFQNSYFPVRGERDRVIAVCISSKDITERKLTEKALNRIRAEREEYQFQLQSILDNTPLSVFVKDLHGKYLLANKSFRELVNVSDQELIGKTDFDINTPEDAIRYKKADDTVIETLQSVELEETLLKNGKEQNLLLVKFPLFDRNSTIYGVGCIATDYTDKVEHRKLLIEAKRKAESAEQLQEQFLANMSHEIRTPMNGIIGMTNILMGTALNTEQKDYVSVIKQSSDNLLFLINDILDLSKIKSGKLSLESTGFNLQQVLHNTLAPFYPRAKEKGVGLYISHDPLVPAHLVGDPYRLNQILNNLLSNALKFTEQGDIKVNIKPLNKTADTCGIEFTVSDTGVGIPADKLEGIFNSFEQANSSVTRKYGGTGLGLAITKKLVEMQEGHLEVKSVAGAGSIFRFTIVYGIDQAPSSISLSTEQKDKGINSLAGKRILVAEDNEINQKVIYTILHKEGLIVTIADNGRQAVNLLELGHSYDLIILDLQMPEMDGYQTSTYIRSKLQLNIPIIAMTASALRNEKARCLELGMNEYLAKPFSPDELFGRLKNLLLTGNASNYVQGERQTGGSDNELYNLSHIYEMEDADYFTEILQLFLHSTPLAIREMKEEALYENWDTVYRKAHKLKSALGILQMKTMLELTTMIEKQAQAGAGTELINAELKQLSELFELIRPMIEAELAAGLPITI